MKVCCGVQVRPLLEVTENEEKLSQKEQELRQVTDRYEKLRVDHDELERQHAVIAEEKLVLTEQLRAEAEMSAEAEEVQHLFDVKLRGGSLNRASDL